MTVTRFPASDTHATDGNPLPSDSGYGVAALPDGPDLGYVLTLYVASLTPRSSAAIQSVRDVCDKHLKGRYSLEVVDIYEQPSLAKREQILAAPTLIKHLPLPLRRLIGDMADEHRVLLGLDLRTRDASQNPSA
ncbi:circadian clock protein KaiB [Thiocapsa imhoffii]|uniref:Circadian clock protein KaiB n=1 Tax=Thiocapsa imhoffii TaxID=382777 RepID=A0A9X0WFF6_9GAMM|nr:circadian clock KaiB family protein [Thiocapsa imhoffii]MBK1643711.1 circadian clock protein KaiB [Thiocapsa imhoffii]